MAIADRRKSVSFGKDSHAKTSSKILSPTLRRSKLRSSMPKRLLPARKLQIAKPKASVAAQLPSAPEPHANQSKPSTNKNVIFQFFLANEHHGVVPQAFENCETMGSFFDKALASWGALGEERHQPRMAAVKVTIEGMSRPMVVLWRDQESFKTMMDMVLEQAAGKQKNLNVEVRCYKRE